MEVDFSKTITGLDGKELTDGGVIVDLKAVCRNALLSNYEQDRNVTGEEKYKRYEIAKKVIGVAILSTEEVVKLKELVSRCYPPLVVGPVFDMLEGKGEKNA